MRKTTMMIAVTLASLAGTSAVMAQEVYPSFDCARARLAVEHMICASPKLAEKDRAESARYRDRMASLVGPGQMDQAQRDQRSWLRSRNACTTARCVAASYDYRMNQLGAN